MKFLASTLLSTDSQLAVATGTEHDRLLATVELAEWAEGLGYDGFGVGERHDPAGIPLGSVRTPR